MNNKGQVMGVFLLLVIGIIGLVIVADFASTVTGVTQVTNETMTATNGSSHTLANTCVVAEPDGVYDWTNSTAVASTQYTLTPSSWPHRSAQVITYVASGFDHNGTTIGLNYTYNCNYPPSSVVRLVLNNLGVLLALALLMMAGGWFVLR